MGSHRHVSTIVALLILCVSLAHAVNNYCWPGMSCFPSNEEQSKFMVSIELHELFPFQPGYDSIVVMQNTRTTKFPHSIVTPFSTEEVQKAVLFARKFNLHMTVISSGHDYFGRSTGDGSFQISLRNISDIDVKLSSSRHPDGEVTIGSGAPWLSVYEKLNKYNRVVVGGSAHTVAMGGYTHGGGHSPMSRMFGLAVDNLLEVELVLADGSKAIASADGTEITSVDGKVNHTTDSSLFWALRGGGGGTFGISTKFTFKIHKAAPGVVNLNIVYPMILKNGTFIGDEVLKKMSEIILTAPRNWGGYFSINGYPDGNTRGSISLFGNHYGTWETASRTFMDELYNFNPEWQKYRYYTNYTTFLDYERTAIDAKYYTTYVSNILMNNRSFTPEWRKTLIENAFAFPLNKSAIVATGTWIGGKVHEVDIADTAVHPGFRECYMSLTSGVGWSAGFGDHENEFVEEGQKLREKMRPFGHGSYRNEGSADSPSWKDDFWGSNYDRLLEIKRKYDPENWFSCLDCVGSDVL
ncbi:FAD-linked oxidoreductase CHGG_01242-2-like [Mizuhopecten yessoensis]|uniref:6-hydroxy-D-nicotine oxidase n=1 Tax=Mizuhopecten yessoensis TaxID=6573 RepID=A0A210QLE5_MIZYE|nr:FAD-linked oxidoreductase CHGG_01242-2-like [Mizuhopecten yessoensis]OWF49557.1 6-hydroxy-D-nicotine oxidase [Mizuhopecten yessoensis]